MGLLHLKHGALLPKYGAFLLAFRSLSGVRVEHIARLMECYIYIPFWWNISFHEIRASFAKRNCAFSGIQGSVGTVWNSVRWMCSLLMEYGSLFMESGTLLLEYKTLWLTFRERWGAGVETQKNVRGEIGGWGRVPFNEPYAPSLSTIYDGA